MLVFLVFGCSDSDPEPVPPPGVMPPTGIITCKVDEIEFRNDDDIITGVREFNYNVNKQNRLESVSIIEGIGDEPLNLRFEFHYGDEFSEVPNSITEIFGGDVISSIDFSFDSNGNLTEFIQNPVLESSIPPQSHLFFYEPSELANDSINTRIIIFDIENLTREWIDVLPALFTTGGQRITRFDRVTFRGDLLEFCEFSYNEEGFLEVVVCRNADFILTEVWNFSYDKRRLISAFRQLPNSRTFTDYGYDSQGKPVTANSNTNGIFFTRGAYFYLCR